MRKFHGVSVREANIRRAFTLVELLIVITIIGVLVSLLMPAVQSAQESGRRAMCSNNLHQMAMGCLALESKYQHLPGGGWGWRWGGEPDRGFGMQQPGGWLYNILPFIDQTDLHDQGKGLMKRGDTMKSNTPRADAGKKIAQTAIPLFICPTRRKAQLYPYHGAGYYNITEPSPSTSHTDYAANSGSNATNVNDPGGLGQGPNSTYDPNYDWSQVYGSLTSTNNNAYASTGVIFRASQLPMAQVRDGASYTYLIGERNLNKDCYYTGLCQDDDQGWDEGYDWDINRWTHDPPSQDRAGVSSVYIFGSAHSAGFNMAFCDGSVAKINYTIDPTFHQQLGHRSDGEPTQLQGLTQ